MNTVVQWVHLVAAVLGIGGMGFLLVCVLPACRGLEAEQRDLFLRRLLGRFRWVSWAAIALLLLSGLYNVREYYWDLRWGMSWNLLTLKIFLAMLVFLISLSLTIPLKILARFRARRTTWLLAAFSLGILVIFISAYLRRS